jgi:hypothetical protein
MILLFPGTHPQARSLCNEGIHSINHIFFQQRFSCYSSTLGSAGRAISVQAGQKMLFEKHAYRAVGCMALLCRGV